MTRHKPTAPRDVPEYRFEVINKDTRLSHGTYETYEEARGCVEFDRLDAYEIWELSDDIIEEEG